MMIGTGIIYYNSLSPLPFNHPDLHPDRFQSRENIRESMNWRIFAITIFSWPLGRHAKIIHGTFMWHVFPPLRVILSTNHDFLKRGRFEVVSISLWSEIVHDYQK
jgi:hypothetical protein